MVTENPAIDRISSWSMEKEQARIRRLAYLMVDVRLNRFRMKLALSKARCDVIFVRRYSKVPSMWRRIYKE